MAHKNKKTLKDIRWQLAAGVLLIAASFLIYLAHYAIFRDVPFLVSYVITDLAFLPVEVLLVTMIINKVLEVRGTKERLKKLNMIIGVFFSEIGTTLLADFSDIDPGLEKIKEDLIINHSDVKEFGDIAGRLAGNEYGVDIHRVNFEELKSFLVGKREFVIRLMENPILLEHESFTDLLWAVLHLTEEFTHRTDFKGLPESDLHHLRNDIKRAYTALVVQWISYMEHLKENYPYLFSLALRLNPFDKNASAVVR